MVSTISSSKKTSLLNSSFGTTPRIPPSRRKRSHRRYERLSLQSCARRKGFSSSRLWKLHRPLSPFVTIRPCHGDGRNHQGDNVHLFSPPLMPPCSRRVRRVPRDRKSTRLNSSHSSIS